MSTEKPCSLGRRERGGYQKALPPIKGGQKAVRTFAWVHSLCRNCYTNTHVTHMHRPHPKGQHEAEVPCPVPGILRVFTVWKKHSGEDECEEETSPLPQKPQTSLPKAHGSTPGQGKGPLEGSLRRLIYGNSHQRGRSHSDLSCHYMVLRRHCLTALFNHPGSACQWQDNALL